MVAAIDNRCEIEGVVTGRSPHPAVGRWDVLTVRVTAVRPVAGHPDLLASRVGGEVDVAVDRAALPNGGLDGRVVRGQVTVAGPGVVRAVTDGGEATGLRVDPAG